MFNGFDVDVVGFSLLVEVGGVLSVGGLCSFIVSVLNVVVVNEVVYVKVIKSVFGSLVVNFGGLFGGGGNVNVDFCVEVVVCCLLNVMIFVGMGLVSVNSG